MNATSFSIMKGAAITTTATTKKTDLGENTTDNEEVSTPSSSSSAASSSSSSSSSLSSSDKEVKDEPIAATTATTPQKNENKNETKRPWWKNGLLAIVALLNIPMYSMLVWFIPYMGILLFWSPQKEDSTLFSYDLCIYVIKPLMVLYIVYGVYDPTPQAPTYFIHTSEWKRWLQDHCRRNIFFTWTAAYFPCRLVKTHDISPEKSYIFGYHPHGVISMGSNLALSTDACDFYKTFPGIRRCGVTLNATFWAPVFREWLLWLGFSSANKATLQSRLTHGESLVLVPGGAAEALHAVPKSMKLLVKHRKGFVQLALETNSQLVPCIGFGENDLFDTIYMGHHHHHHHHHHHTKMNEKNNSNAQVDDDDDDSSSASSEVSVPPPKASHWSLWVWKTQHWLKDHMTFSTPIWFHLFPRQRPLNVVVGPALEFPRQKMQGDNNIITPEMVQEYHAMYLQALETLYEKHKSEYGYENVPLEFL